MSNASDILGGDAKAWVSGVIYKPGQVVKSPADNYQAYVRVSAAGSGATDPSSDTANFRPFGGRAIKSVQRGVITIPVSTTSATATITAVVPGKSRLVWLGGLGVVNGGEARIPRLDLTNATTITATVNVITSAGMPVGWQLEESY